MTDFQFVAQINPMKILEWEQGRPLPTSDNPTPDRLLDLLSALGVPKGMNAFKKRYGEISQEDQGLLLFPMESALVENVFGPLRQAKMDYVLGNFVGVISLCGMVAEKVAILIHAINTPDKSEREKFECQSQAKRVPILKDRNLVSHESVKAFGTIRGSRRRYLHYWTSTRDQKTAREAVRMYGAAVKLAMDAMGVGFSNGKVTLAPELAKYLATQGAIHSVQQNG